MGNIKVKQSITKKELNDAIMLDNDSYIDDSVKGTFEMCSSWYKKNKNIYTIVKDGENLIGYINFMPLKNNCYAKYKQGNFHDVEISADDIEIYESGKTYNCLFCSVVIKEEYRNSSVVLSLLKGFFAKIKQLSKKGIIIDRILADCVSKDGEKFIKRLGFDFLRKSNTGSKIYELIMKKNILRTK